MMQWEGVTACGGFSERKRVDAADDGDQIGTDGGEERKVPFLQRLLHDGVVGIGEDALRDAESLLEADAVRFQQADELRDGHDGMRVVQLHGMLRRKEGIIAAMPCPVAAEQVLQGRADQHVLLLDAQKLPAAARVVRIEELRDVLRAVFVARGLGVLLRVEQGKVDFMQALALPQAQGSDVLCAVTDDRHVVRDGPDVSGFHGNGDGQIVPPDGPRVSETGPVVRLLLLPAVREALAEKAVTVAQAVAGQRDAVRDGTVQKAGGQAAQTAVPEGVVFHVLQQGQVDAARLHLAADVLQDAEAVKVVVNHPPHQVFGGQIIGLALAAAFRFFLDPQRGQLLHGGKGERLVQLGGVRLL